MNKIYLNLKKVDENFLNKEISNIKYLKNEERNLIENINNMSKDIKLNNFIYTFYYKKEIIGFSIGNFKREKNSIWVKMFFIAENYRNNGIGKYMWNNIEKKFYKTSFKNIYLLVYKNNKKGIIFWQKNGFQNIKLKNRANCFLNFDKYVIMYKMI
jgi:ribosomal protein S18 acetylase RimI-like enzyme